MRTSFGSATPNPTSNFDCRPFSTLVLITAYNAFDTFESGGTSRVDC